MSFLLWIDNKWSFSCVCCYLTKLKKINPSVLSPHPNFLKFYFVYEILKLRLETLSLEVLVKGGCKMHFIFKGVHALCVLWNLIPALYALFSKSFHSVFPSGPWGSAGQRLKLLFQGQLTGGRAPGPSPILCPPHHTTGTRGAMALSVCPGSQSLLLTAGVEGKDSFWTWFETKIFVVVIQIPFLCKEVYGWSPFTGYCFVSSL